MKFVIDNANVKRYNKLYAQIIYNNYCIKQ